MDVIAGASAVADDIAVAAIITRCRSCVAFAAAIASTAGRIVGAVAACCCC